ncbi:MAG: glycine zipper domain-containing protein [Pyrinomonadaceae bacterium]
MKKFVITLTIAVITGVGLPISAFADTGAKSFGATTASYSGGKRKARGRQVRGRSCAPRRRSSNRSVRRNSSYRVAGTRYRNNGNFYSRHRNATNVAIGAGAGAIIGGIIGGRKGMLIGAGVGAGSGAIYTYGVKPKKKRSRYYRN